MEKYFPIIKKNIKRKKFLELVQGNITIWDYITKFERLSRFAYNLIDTSKVKNQQYHKGLILPFQRLNLSHLNHSFEALVGLSTS